MVAVFAVGVRRVGGVLARAIRVEERGGGLHLLLGLAAYILVGEGLGAAGLLRWPLLASLALLPGSLSAAGVLARWIRSPSWFVLRPPPVRAMVGVCIAAVALPFIINALTPPTHYDLLANYLAVAKEDLLQGGITPLEHNVYSSQSLALHVLLAYLLSLAELVRGGPFMCGGAMTVPAFGFLALLLIVRSLAVLARRLVPAGADPRPVAVLASLLFLGFPQTQILASLHSCDLVTTALALMLVAELLDIGWWDVRTSVALGIAAGLLVAAKPQLAELAAVAAIVIALRARRLAAVAAFALAALAVVAPALGRNAAAYGSALFPYMTAGSPHDAAARLWLAENGYLGGATLRAFAANLAHLFTLQPETGISFAVLPLLALRRAWRLELTLFALVPLFALAVLSGSTYHALRWAQPSVALIFLMVAANWMALAAGRPWGTGIAGGFAVIAFLIGWFHAQAINSTLDVFRTDEATFVGRRLPSYAVRARLVVQARRVLYVKELDAYFGAENGILPSVFDDDYYARFFRADTASEIAARLEAAGISHLAVGRAYNGRLGPGLGWHWLDERHAAVVARFFSSLPVVSEDHEITVYALGSIAR